jgi:hypothetical protein
MEWEAKLDPHGYCRSHGYCVKVAYANLVDIKTLQHEKTMREDPPKANYDKLGRPFKVAIK